MSRLATLAHTIGVFCGDFGDKNVGVTMLRTSPEEKEKSLAGGNLV